MTQEGGILLSPAAFSEATMTSYCLLYPQPFNLEHSVTKNSWKRHRSTKKRTLEKVLYKRKQRNRLHHVTGVRNLTTTRITMVVRCIQVLSPFSQTSTLLFSQKASRDPTTIGRCSPSNNPLALLPLVSPSLGHYRLLPLILRWIVPNRSRTMRLS